MSAATLIRELADTGIRLSANGDRLHVEAKPGTVTPKLRQRLTEHKADLLATLKAERSILAPTIAAAYLRLKRELAENPTVKTAVETWDADADPVLLAIAVRGAGYATLRIPKARYDGFKLLEIVHRWNEEGTPCPS